MSASEIVRNGKDELTETGKIWNMCVGKAEKDIHKVHRHEYFIMMSKIALVWRLVW